MRGRAWGLDGRTSSIASNWRRSEAPGGTWTQYGSPLPWPTWTGETCSYKRISLRTSLPIGIGRSARCAAAVSSESPERGARPVPNDGGMVRVGTLARRSAAVLPRRAEESAHRVDTASRPNNARIILFVFLGATVLAFGDSRMPGLALLPSRLARRPSRIASGHGADSVSRRRSVQRRPDGDMVHAAAARVLLKLHCRIPA